MLKDKKNIFLKLWELFIILVILFSTFLLIKHYLTLTPETFIKLQKYNLIISIIFLADVIIRIIVYGKSYIKSVEIIIDILACLDIITPLLNPIKSIRYFKILRLIRLFRVARLIKLTSFFSLLEEQKSFIMNFSLIMLIIFIFLSLTISNFVQTKTKEIVMDEYKQFLISVYDETSKDEELIRKLLSKNNLISFNFGNFEYNVLPNLKIDVDKKYFLDDIITVQHKNLKATFVLKRLTILKSIVELIIILSVIPVIFITLLILKISHKK